MVMPFAFFDRISRAVSNFDARMDKEREERRMRRALEESQNASTEARQVRQHANAILTVMQYSQKQIGRPIND